MKGLEMWTIRNARLCDDRLVDIRIDGEKIAHIDPAAALTAPIRKLSALAENSVPSSTEEFDAEAALVLPAMIDIHVHSREPGLAHKETWATLAQAAHRGGVIAVGDMPNTIPPTLDAASIIQKAEFAGKSGLLAKFYLGVSMRNVHNIPSIMRECGKHVCGIKIYYGHSTGNMMFDDLDLLGRTLSDFGNYLISFHSEDQCIIDGNQKIYGQYADLRDNESFRTHSMVRSSAAALSSTKKILEWSRTFDLPVHLAHLSTPDEVDILGEYRAKGARVTTEVTPHHLLFSEEDYSRLGPFLKVNPPVRSRAEVERLKKLFAEGGIDVVATDHAPHTVEEKKNTVAKAPSGLPSIEYFVPLLLKLGSMLHIPLPKLVEMGAKRPAQLLGLDGFGELSTGSAAHFIVVREHPFVATNLDVASKCGWTPFDGMEFPGFVSDTWYNGARIFHRKFTADCCH